MFFNFKKKREALGKITKLSFKKLTKQIIQGICGFNPYEKKIIELLKLGKDKKALKLGKKSLGNIFRSKKKKESLSAYLRKK